MEKKFREREKKFRERYMKIQLRSSSQRSTKLPFESGTSRAISAVAILFCLSFLVGLVQARTIFTRTRHFQHHCSSQTTYSRCCSYAQRPPQPAQACKKRSSHLEPCSSTLLFHTYTLNPPSPFPLFRLKSPDLHL